MLTYLSGVVTSVFFVFVLGMIVNASQGKGSVLCDVVLFEKSLLAIGASEINPKGEIFGIVASSI